MPSKADQELSAYFRWVYGDVEHHKHVGITLLGSMVYLIPLSSALEYVM